MSPTLYLTVAVTVYYNTQRDVNLTAVGPTLTAEVCVSSRVRKNTGTVQYCTLYTVHTGHCTTLGIPTPTPHFAGKKLGTVSYRAANDPSVFTITEKAPTHI